MDQIALFVDLGVYRILNQNKRINDGIKYSGILRRGTIPKDKILVLLHIQLCNQKSDGRAL